MAKKVKCPHCLLTFDRETVPCVHIKNRYLHLSCHEAINSNITQEQQDEKDLDNYIMTLFKTTYVDARVKKQIKSMMLKYGYGYSGILKTLVYWYEVKKNSIEKANGGIGIVPYVFEDAKKYFYAIFVAQEKNKDKDAQSFVRKGRTVTIISPKRTVKKMRLVDLDALEEETNG